MSWKRPVARAISEVVAWTRAAREPRSGIRILLYHAVGTHLATDFYGMSIDPMLFERHMAALAASPGVSIVDIDPKQLSGLNLRVAVSFDDGYKDNLYVASPILLKYKIPFTVFVTTAFVESQCSLYLTRAELRELASLPGVAIGSHGATHVRLADCNDRTLWHELSDSRCYLQDLIGRDVTALSYPHGSVNRRVAEAAKRAGYAIGVCSQFDINNESRDSLLLCRTEVVATDSQRVFLQKLHGDWDWCRWRRKDPTLA